MDDIAHMKVQLVAVMVMSQDVEKTDNWQDRKHALEDMQRALQSAKPLIMHYAADLMVD